MTKQGDEALGCEVFLDDNENLPSTGVNRIPKQSFEKSNEFKKFATVKDFEDWKSKLMDYYIVTCIDK